MSRWSYSIRLLPITRTFTGTINTGLRAPRIDAFDTEREPLERVVRLATAAPELLEALDAILDAHRRVVHGEATHVPAHLLNAGEAAAKKAKGE